MSLIPSDEIIRKKNVFNFARREEIFQEFGPARRHPSNEEYSGL
jgi:hypothetical protein